MRKSSTYIANPPGITIKEQLEDRKLTQKEFALRMEMSEKHICKLINGDVLLTTDVALRLENVLGISAQFWMNLEAIYREKIARIEMENAMDEDIRIVSNFPYSQMVSLGWVEPASTKEQKVSKLRKFFEINRLGLLFENKSLNVLFRRVSESEKSNYGLLAWAQKAKLEARNREVGPINLDRLYKRIKRFRQMTMEKPEVFCDELVNELSRSGVALVFLPHMDGSFLHGATFYDGNHIVLGLTVRGKDADKFWFSFFHELAHILLGHIGKDYYEDMEYEANSFAEDALIPIDEYHAFIATHSFSEKTIIKFAYEIKIDVGIVVGRLQKDGYISYSTLNNCKTKYLIS